MAKAEVIEGLDCTGSVRDGIALVLTRRLEEMYSLRERALDFNDPEGVHDMRVSSRRLRSALRDFSTYLKKNKLAGPTEVIKSLADALGQVRDDDVAIMELQKIRGEAPPERAADIQQLIDIRVLKRNQARRSLQSLLSPRKLNRLKREFNEALPAALAVSKRKKDETTYYQVATAVIKKRVGELKGLADSLHKPHRTKRLHRMRIAAKRLRYAVELFAPCWGDRSMSFGRQIAQMQSSLGGLHDCDVWIEYFGDWLSQERPEVDPQTDSQRDAMVWLLGHFTKLRAKYFRTALSQWREWERKDLLAKLVNTHTEENLAVKPTEPAAVQETSVEPIKTRPRTRETSVKPKRESDIRKPVEVAQTEAVEPKEVTPVKRDVTLEELNGQEEQTQGAGQLSGEQENGIENEDAEAVRVMKLGKAETESAGGVN